MFNLLATPTSSFCKMSWSKISSDDSNSVAEPLRDEMPESSLQGIFRFPTITFFETTVWCLERLCRGHTRPSKTLDKLT